MGMTNIRRPMEIVSRASATAPFTDLASIEPFGKHVMVQSGALNQNDINKYVWCLRTADFGCWISKGAAFGTTQIVGASESMQVPIIRISPGMQRSEPQDDRFYVLILEGKSGNDRVKVILEDSVDKAAVAMMHAALNGHSTVFSAAVLRCRENNGRGPLPTLGVPISSLGPSDWRFAKVDSLRPYQRGSTQAPFIQLHC